MMYITDPFLLTGHACARTHTHTHTHTSILLTFINAPAKPLIFGTFTGTLSIVNSPASSGQ